MSYGYSTVDRAIEMNIPPSSKITKEEAIAYSKKDWWSRLEDKEVAIVQLTQRKMCMQFDEFHRVVQSAIGEPVWTHEFADPGRLIRRILLKEVK